MINNAAVFTAAPITEIKREDYQQVFDINVSGTLFTLQAVAKKMIERGKGGKDYQHGQSSRPSRRVTRCCVLRD